MGKFGCLLREVADERSDAFRRADPNVDPLAVPPVAESTEEAKPESTDWLGLIELGALEAAGMGADGRQGVERLRSPVKGPCEIKAR